MLKLNKLKIKIEKVIQEAARVAGTIAETLNHNSDIKFLIRTDCPRIKKDGVEFKRVQIHGEHEDKKLIRVRLFLVPNRYLPLTNSELRAMHSQHTWSEVSNGLKLEDFLIEVDLTGIK